MKTCGVSCYRELPQLTVLLTFIAPHYYVFAFLSNRLKVMGVYSV